jgi:hypothetical protein
VSSARTPGTGGVIDLWRNNDGTPSKLATGRWAEGQGRPQGVGNRWRGWYVGDDGKPRTKRFRTEVEAEGWSNAQRGKVVTSVQIVDGVVPEYFAAARQTMDAEAAEEFERNCREMYDQQARLAITPQWVRYYDFGAGRMPRFLQDLAERNQS